MLAYPYSILDCPISKKALQSLFIYLEFFKLYNSIVYGSWNHILIVFKLILFSVSIKKLVLSKHFNNLVARMNKFIAPEEHSGSKISRAKGSTILWLKKGCRKFLLNITPPEWLRKCLLVGIHAHNSRYWTKQFSKKKIYVNKFTNRKKHVLILFWMQLEIHDYRYYSDLHTDKTELKNQCCNNPPFPV